MPQWVIAGWRYFWGVISAHPYSAITLALSFAFSLAALIVSIRSVRAANRQAKAAERQAEEATKTRELNEKAIADQAEAMRTQTEIARRSAAAAEQSAKTAGESMEKGYRAWVTVESVQALESSGFPMPRLAKTTLVNSGATPALDLQVFQWAEVLNEWPKSIDLEKLGSYVSANLGGGLKYEEHTRTSLGTASLATIREDRVILYVYGYARYRDVFNERHTTVWCYEWRRTDQVFAPVGPLNTVA